jgi:hypothetical protein
MLRVVLTAADLGHVRVASRPAPILELRTLLREPLPARKAIEPDGGQAKIELVRSLVAQPCAPGFVLPALSDADDAIETVASARRDAIRRDLDDNVTAGFPLPGWTADLARPGPGGTRARHGLQAALTHVVSAYIEPRTRWAAPVVEARTRAWQARAAADGPQVMLNTMHPGIRCRGSVLEVELASGAQVEATATGAGIRVVPTLSSTPGVTLSSDGHAPIVLTCPVPLPAGLAPEPGTLSARARRAHRPEPEHAAERHCRWPRPRHPGTRAPHRAGPGLGQRAHPDPPPGRPGRRQAGRFTGHPPGDTARLGAAAPVSLIGAAGLDVSRRPASCLRC